MSETTKETTAPDAVGQDGVSPIAAAAREAAGGTIKAGPGDNPLPPAPDIGKMNVAEFLEHKADVIVEAARGEADRLRASAADLRAKAAAGEKHAIDLLAHPLETFQFLHKAFRDLAG